MACDTGCKAYCLYIALRWFMRYAMCRATVDRGRGACQTPWPVIDTTPWVPKYFAFAGGRRAPASCRCFASEPNQLQHWQPPLRTLLRTSVFGRRLLARASVLDTA